MRNLRVMSSLVEQLYSSPTLPEELEELIAAESELNTKIVALTEKLAKAEQDATVSRDATKAITEELAKTREQLLAIEEKLAEAGGARSRARDDVILGR